MNSKLSFNCKYYKHSNRNEILHVNRKHKKVENSLPKLVPNNFGNSDIDKVYNNIKAKVEGIKGKRLQKNANTFVDGVMGFNRDHINELIKQHGRDEFEKIMTVHCEQFLAEMKKEFGFEPIGFYFHADEGHVDAITGEWKENYHAHFTMFNYDFKKNCAPLRKLQRTVGSDFSYMQDIAGRVFAPLGFVRGDKKTETKKDHLKKDKYIAKKQAEIIENIQHMEERIYSSINELKKVENNISFREEYLAELNDDLKFVFEFRKSLIDIYKKMSDKNKEHVSKIVTFFLNHLPEGMADKAKAFFKASAPKALQPIDAYDFSDISKVENDVKKAIEGLKNASDVTTIKVEKDKPKIN